MIPDRVGKIEQCALVFDQGPSFPIFRSYLRDGSGNVVSIARPLHSEAGSRFVISTRSKSRLDSSACGRAGRRFELFEWFLHVLARKMGGSGK